MTRAAGLTLVELLAGMLLGLVAVAAAWAVVSAARTATTRAGRSAAAARAAADAVDQLTRDVRVAGHDPRRFGVVALVVAEAARLETTADLDGNGSIDLASEEHVTWRVASTAHTLQRVVGTQTLPIASDVAPSGFRLRYRDAAGTELEPATAAERAAVRFVAIELRVDDGITDAGIVVEGGARLLAGDAR